MISNIFSSAADENTLFLENKDKFFILEVFKTEEIQRNLNSNIVVKNIKKELEQSKKRKLISKIISEINQQKFSKLDFDKLSKNKNVKIQKITINNLGDTAILKEQVLNQIYSFPEKKVIVAHNISFTDNFLIFPLVGPSSA